MQCLGSQALLGRLQHYKRCQLPTSQSAGVLRSCRCSGRGVSRRMWTCHAAASDQRNASEPMYLSDLIMFESDTDASASPSSTSSDADAPGSSSSRDPAAGQQGEGGDPTMRAQEIISRATEVLAAARAALGTSSLGSSSSSAAGDSSSSSSRSRSAVMQPPPAAPPSTGTPTTAGSSSGSSWQVGPPSSRGSSGSSSSSSFDGRSPSGSSDGGSSEALTRRWSPLSEDQDLTRHVLQNALDQMQRSGAPIAAPQDEEEDEGAAGQERGSLRGPGGAGLSSSSSSSRRDRDIRKGRGGAGAVVDDGHGPAPSWAQSLLGSDDFGGSSYNFPSGVGGGPAPTLLEPQLQLQQAADRPSAWGWAAEDNQPLTLPPATLGLLSQSELDAQRARMATLPPLQSVLELTTAFRPPERSGGVAAPAPAPATAATAAATATATATAEAAVAAEPVGRVLPDGSGRLADGTWWEKKSGIERGKNGYWKRWQLLKGGNAEGTLEWEETWWEASDWTGLKEMGARKEGRNTDGAAWRETWSERLMYASNDLDTVVERNAHKWAAEGNGDEWEEKWGEHYHVSGKVAKYADKWGKSGPNVWHERWGEDYDAGGDACVKWTDKWAERLLPGGAREQWGDKWHEAFANGRGEKNGEVWSVGASGDRYQRWWGEHHLGNRAVRRFGHSTTGEHWDHTTQMDTYYNPVPHFGFKHALSHSPQLRNVPLQPKQVNAKDPFGPGLDDL